MTAAKKKQQEYELLGQVSVTPYCGIDLPVGTTHVECDLDYSGCYYESDKPSTILLCYKEIEPT